MLSVFRDIVLDLCACRGHGRQHWSRGLLGMVQDLSTPLISTAIVGKPEFSAIEFT